MDITNYTIDLALKPTTLDLWHVCLAGTSAILAGALILTLLSLVMCLARRKESIDAEPQIKIVEKIVQAEPIVKQCENGLAKMRDVYIAEKIPEIIADRHLKQMRLQTTRLVLQDMMYSEAARSVQ